ncbi:hypothetical protein KUV89_04590 [Marinobacter hydrocarbonoclasticus]|nr:hypothetical protein [Marinobacter nauticus]
MKRTELIRELKRVGGLFRAGATFDANRQVAALMPEMVNQFSSLSAERLAQAQVLFPELLSCMERQDYVGLADYFEFELRELFSQSGT